MAYFNNLVGQVAYFDNLVEVTGLFRQFSVSIARTLMIRSILDCISVAMFTSLLMRTVRRRPVLQSDVPMSRQTLDNSYSCVLL